jgi:threonine synthase
MDIQISSNFERALFDAADRDPGTVARLMTALKEEGAFTLPSSLLSRLRAIYAARRVDEAEVLATMAEMHRRHGLFVDPHSAIGLAAAGPDLAGEGHPVLCVGTAHPAKFPDAVEAATGERPPVPPQIAALDGLEETCERLPADTDAVRAHILKTVS